MSDCIGTGCKADALLLQIAELRAERDALVADLAAARDERDRLKEHNVLLVEAINRLHEVAMGEWDGSESEISDLVNAALAGEKK